MKALLKAYAKEASGSAGRGWLATMGRQTKPVLWALLLLLPFSVYSQSYQISGQLRSAKAQSAIAEATVFLQETGTVEETAADGRFRSPWTCRGNTT